MRGHLFLPPGVQPSGSFRPADGTDRPIVRRCETPVRQDEDGAVEWCGEPAYSEAEHEQHVARCAAEHHDVIVAILRKRRPEIQKAWDPELEAWVRANGAAIYAGRKRTYGGGAR